jgi:hypothetical protein
MPPDSSAHSAICPTAAAVTLASGTLTAKNVGNPQKLQFVDPTGLIGPARYCLSRFQVVIPFESELGVRLDRRRVLRFTETNSVVMSNTCVCDLGINQPPDHFLAHYEVVQAKRRPTIKPAKPAGPGAKVPWWPDLCLVGYVEI